MAAAINRASPMHPSYNAGIKPHVRALSSDGNTASASSPARSVATHDMHFFRTQSNLSSHQLIVTTTRGVYTWSRGAVTTLFRSGSGGVIAAKRTTTPGGDHEVGAAGAEMLAIADSQILLLHRIDQGMQHSYRLRGKHVSSVYNSSFCFLFMEFASRSLDSDSCVHRAGFASCNTMRIVRDCSLTRVYRMLFKLTHCRQKNYKILLRRIRLRQPYSPCRQLRASCSPLLPRHQRYSFRI